MKERPILFNGEMVRAVLDGRKTQTRRVVKGIVDLVNDKELGYYFDAYDGGPQWNWWTDDGRVCNGREVIHCPYGVPGDRLWVRETWIAHKKWNNTKPRDIPEGEPICYPAYEKPLGIDWGKSRPSIFLPRWASRILLEVVSVRVERVQEISDSDAAAEGAPNAYTDRESEGAFDYQHPGNARGFQYLWNSINAKRGYGWDANSWVWVVEFKVVPPKSS